MSAQRIPNSGPLGRDHLDELRVSALMALDAAPNGSVPDALLDYIRALEREYLDRRHRESVANLDSLWAPRREKFSGEES